MTLQHIEVHICETAQDAARLANAGLPRFDLEPSQCGACTNRVGEVMNREGEKIAWRALAVVVWEDGLSVLCSRCYKPLDKIRTVR